MTGDVLDLLITGDVSRRRLDRHPGRDHRRGLADRRRGQAAGQARSPLERLRGRTDVPDNLRLAPRRVRLHARPAGDPSART
jgi:hypothetical protein